MKVLPFVFLFLGVASASFGSLLAKVKEKAPQALPMMKLGLMREKEKLKKLKEKGNIVGDYPLPPSVCGSLYLDFLTCANQEDDDEDDDVDDDWDDDDDDDDDDDFNESDCATAPNFYQAGQNMSLFEFCLVYNVYDPACAITASDFYDCSFNEYCLNTIDVGSCSKNDCRYYP